MNRYFLAAVSSIWLVAGVLIALNDNPVVKWGIVGFLVIWNFIVAFIFDKMVDE
jgi:hypothetical protein